MPVVPTAKKATAKKAVAKAEVKATKGAKKAPKAKTERAPSTLATELRAQILKAMTKGKPMTSRQIVEALGRVPGQAQGGPVVNQLKKMAEEKIVTYGAEEGRGFSWVKK